MLEERQRSPGQCMPWSTEPLRADSERENVLLPQRRSEGIERVCRGPWAGDALRGRPMGRKVSAVSREELQGKGPEVGTSWFVWDPERRVLKLNCSRGRGRRVKGGRLQGPNQTGPSPAGTKELETF